MKWKKTSTTLAVAGAVGMALAGCSSGGATGGSSTSGAPVTLRFAAVTLTEAGRGPAIKAWLDEFNSSQTKIKVVPDGIPFSTFAQTVLTQMGAGSGPDLIRFDISTFEQAAGSNLLAPLDSMIDASKYDLIKGPDAYNIVNGKRYGFSFDATSYALIYNTDLISTPPTTFDELLATTKAATKNGVYGMAFRQTAAELPGMMQDLFNYVYGYGGDFADGHKLTLNSPKVVAGLEAYQKLYDANVIPKGASAATYRQMFGQNKIAINIDNGGVPAILLGENPNLHLAAAPDPFPVKSQGGILAPIAINAASPHKAEAATFIKWMLEPANQVKLQQIMGAESVATHTTRTAAELAKAPYLKVFDDLVATSKPQLINGFAAKTPDIDKIIVDQVLSALQGQQTMQAAMDKAQQQATAVVSG
ncbi:MAG TPA: sugar ABC transporter substrate-binding protein [Cellulomonadaceae bacterium]|nr:sugar ABC transporter substrate-binding protein [Cellulomonadaceae bacterium]